MGSTQRCFGLVCVPEGMGSPQRYFVLVCVADLFSFMCCVYLFYLSALCVLCPMCITGLSSKKKVKTTFLYQKVLELILAHNLPWLWGFYKEILLNILHDVTFNMCGATSFNSVSLKKRNQMDDNKYIIVSLCKNGQSFLLEYKCSYFCKNSSITSIYLFNECLQ